MAMIGKSVYLEYVSRGPMGASPIESLGWERSGAVRHIDTAWGGRQQAVADLLGDATVAEAGGGKYITRTIPHGYPGYVGFDYFTNGGSSDPYLWCQRVDPIIGYGVPVGGDMKERGRTLIDCDLAKYARARMTAHYGTVPWPVYNDQAMTAQGNKDANGNPDESTWARYCVVEFQPTGQMISMPKGVMGFVSGPGAGKFTSDATIALAPPKLIPYWNVRVKHVQVPIVGAATYFINPKLTAPGPMDTTLGKVNNATFPAQGPYKNKFAAGSLLYVAAIIQRYMSPLGRPMADITHHFQYAQYGQNLVPYLSAANVFGWVEIVAGTPPTFATNLVAKTDGKSIYDWGDFAKLFQAP